MKYLFPFPLPTLFYYSYNLIETRLELGGVQKLSKWWPICPFLWIGLLVWRTYPSSVPVSPLCLFPCDWVVAVVGSLTVKELRFPSTRHWDRQWKKSGSFCFKIHHTSNKYKQLQCGREARRNQRGAVNCSRTGSSNVDLRAGSITKPSDPGRKRPRHVTLVISTATPKETGVGLQRGDLLETPSSWPWNHFFAVDWMHHVLSLTAQNSRTAKWIFRVAACSFCLCDLSLKFFLKLIVSF